MGARQMTVKVSALLWAALGASTSALLLNEGMASNSVDSNFFHYFGALGTLSLAYLGHRLFRMMVAAPPL